MNFHNPFPITAAIPIPAPRDVFVRKYPLRDMAVGESFFVPGVHQRQIGASIRYATCDCRKFATRRVTENGVRGLRIWRTA